MNKIPEKKIDSKFFIYRAIGIIAIIGLFAFSFTSLNSYSDSDSDSMGIDNEIKIPKSEKSSFIELTQDDIISQYDEVFSNLVVRKNSTSININDLGNFESPFKPVGINR